MWTGDLFHLLVLRHAVLTSSFHSVGLCPGCVLVQISAFSEEFALVPSICLKDEFGMTIKIERLIEDVLKLLKQRGRGREQPIRLAMPSQI